MLVVYTVDKNVLFIKPFYFQYKFTAAPTFVSYQPLKEINSTNLSTLLKEAYHFDPWRVIRERTNIPAELREAFAKTNVAELKLHGKKIIDICFNDSFTAIEGIKVRRNFLSSELINQNRLFPLVFEK